MSEVIISVANVPTERARRYGHQLASHMGRKIDARWDDESAHGTLIFTREETPGTTQGPLTAEDIEHHRRSK